MKRLNLPLVLCTMIGTSLLYSQNVGINPTGALPDNSAGLDVNFTNKGLLIPRVGLQSATDNVTIPSPATSLLVYNTGTGGLSPAGYYYNAGTPLTPNWVQLMPATGVLTTCGGVLNNYVQKWTGTQLCNSLIFDNGTNVGIGTAAPASKLHVTGEVYSTSGYNDIVYIGGDGAGNDGEVGIQSATRNTITFYNRTQSINADVNMRDILSARHITFNGALQPAGNPGTSGQVLRSQGAGMPPIWFPMAASIVYQNAFNSTGSVCINNTAWTTHPGCSATINLQAGDVVWAWGYGSAMADNDCDGLSDNVTCIFDVRIAVNGADFPDGAWARTTVDNQWGAVIYNGYSIAGRFTAPSTGNYTFELQTRFNNGSGYAITAGNNTSALQSGMMIIVYRP